MELRERRELWIATPEGQDLKLVVHSRLMPARCGHQVEALLFRAELLGLLNTTTGAQVNYARADPPLVWRRHDSALLATVLLMAFMSFLKGGVILPVLMGFMAMAWVPTVLLVRLASNARAKLDVDRAVERVLSISGPSRFCAESSDGSGLARSTTYRPRRRARPCQF